MPESNAESASQGADLRWLIAGAIAGLLAAGYGILRQDDSAAALPETAVARVNERIIGRDSFDRALARLTDASDDDKARLLQRLLDEELLVQRGLELGMAQSDSEVRNAIINSLIASITAEADASSPSDEELAGYLDDNKERFSYVASLAVGAWQTDDEAVAQAFVTALRNGREPPASAEIEAVPDLPPGLMPVEILSDYVGPGIAAAAADMPVNSSAVFARRGRWLVIQVLEKKSAVVTDLKRIKSRVLLDYRRDLANRTIREYTDELHRRADIKVAQP